MILVVQALWKLFDFFYEKIQVKIGNKVDKIQWEQNIADSLENINSKVGELYEQNEKTHIQQEITEQKLASLQESTEASLTLLQERMQENTRSYLIDAHHQFCYQFKKIDDLNLQSIERRYLYYKTSGGDSFVDRLIEEIRELPRVNFYEDVASNKRDNERGE